MVLVLSGLWPVVWLVGVVACDGLMVHYSVYAVNRQAAQGFALLFVRFVHSFVYAQDALFNGSRARGAAGGRMPGADGDAMPGRDDLTADRAAGEAGEEIPP